VVKYLLKRFTVSGFAETFVRRRTFALGISDETFERRRAAAFSRLLRIYSIPLRYNIGATFSSR